MVHEENTKISLKLEKNMIFKSTFQYQGLKELLIDETLESDGIKVGPDASTLLGMAVTGCLCASFLFCLAKRNLTLKDLEARTEISFKKNEQGYLRVEKIDVKIIPKTTNPDIKKRISQCIKEIKRGHMLFEESCIITSSVRDGIKVDVNVDKSEI